MAKISLEKLEKRCSMKESQYRLEQSFKNFEKSLRKLSEQFRLVAERFPPQELPKSLEKPKKHWEHLDKGVYKSNKR